MSSINDMGIQNGFLQKYLKKDMFMKLVILRVSARM